MALTLPTSVYTATRGYAWSAVPAGLAPADLEAFLVDATKDRPDFEDEAAAAAGVIVRRGVVAPFSVRRARRWDAEGRDADYAAFAFCSAPDAAAVDFAALLADPFFTVPSRTPPARLAYDGPAASAAPLPAAGRLLCRNRLDGLDPRAAGALIAAYAAKADFWTVRLAGAVCTVTTSPWHR